MIDSTNTYEKFIHLAIEELKSKNYIQAEEKIKEAMIINPHLPHAHNLYGILEEYLQEYDLARKHYRAAYALDPTYKPSSRNLERISSFYTCIYFSKIDFGEKPEEEEHGLYVIIYDKNHVGHLCKKEME